MSRISVVIPSYNHEKFIRPAVESVLAQSHADLELIVVDDGSSDRSLDYLRSVRDNRFRLVEQANAGAHNAINRGLALAQGEYLAILNSDDIYHPDRLAICQQRLQAGADLVASWLEVIDDKGKALGVKEGWRNMLPWPTAQLDGKLDEVDAFAINLLRSNFVATTSNIVFSRSLYESVGGMANLRFAHDWHFLLCAVQGFRCELIEQPLLQYRIHSTNTISSNRAWMLFEICWIYAVHLNPVLARLSPNGCDAAQIEAEVAFMAGSVNLQGNDKVMWMILQFIERQRQAGREAPEFLLLDDAALRREIVRCVVSAGEVVAGDAQNKVARSGANYSSKARQLTARYAAPITAALALGATCAWWLKK